VLGSPSWYLSRDPGTARAGVGVGPPVSRCLRSGRRCWGASTRERREARGIRSCRSRRV